MDVSSGRTVYELDVSAAGPGSMWFSPKKSVIGMAGGDAVRFFDAATGKLISHNGDFLTEPLSIDFVSENQAVASGGDKVVLLIDVATGKTLARSKDSLSRLLDWLRPRMGKKSRS
jgi:hypothetical protein